MNGLRAEPREDYFGLTDEQFASLVNAVRIADKQHEADGGGTRHWARDFFLPALDNLDLRVVAK